MKSFEFIAAAAVVSLSGLAMAREPVFINLGSGTQISGLSADGLVAVGTQNVVGQGVFRWTAATGRVGIGTSATPGTVRVSADGGAAAWSSGSAYRWAQGGTATPIGSGVVYGISGDGSTVVGTNGLAPFKWSVSGGMTTLPTPPQYPGLQQLNAYGTSYDGSYVIGNMPSGVGGAKGIRWNAAGQTEVLPAVPGYAQDATPTLLTDDGSVAFGIGVGPGGLETIRWTPQTGTAPLAVTTNGYSIPTPYDVTADGSILVGTSAFRAFLWRAGAGPMLVKDVLENEYGMNLGNVTLEFANGISDDGLTIAGWGTNETGQRFGWIVTDLPHSIPAPGTALLVAMAGAAGVRRRRNVAARSLES